MLFNTIQLKPYMAKIDKGIDIEYVEETKPLGDSYLVKLVDRISSLNSVFLLSNLW